MSNNESGNTHSKEIKKEKDEPTCRDFLNNICNRGSRCKFYHPPRENKKSKHEYNFCIDHQNQGCFRDSCRFVHADREDVEIYQRTGDITQKMARAIYIDTRSENINGVPVCKEFLNNGICERDSRCRYWHVRVDNRRPQRAILNRDVGGFLQSNLVGHSAFGNRNGASRRRGPDHDFEYDMPKRQMLGAFNPPVDSLMAGHIPPPNRITELERRNAELSTEVESLKRELRREKERYEDLILIFRQTAVGGGAFKGDRVDPTPVMAPPNISAWQTNSSEVKYGW